MGQTTRWGNLGTKLDGYVGFDTVQEQIRKKSLKRGFEFNTIVVGEPPSLSLSVSPCVCACVGEYGNLRVHVVCWVMIFMMCCGLGKNLEL